MRFGLTVSYWQQVGTNQEHPVNANIQTPEYENTSQIDPRGKCSLEEENESV